MTKTVHVYENHLSGDVYLSDEYEERLLQVCERCGDSDHYIGTVSSLEGLINIFTDDDGFIMHDIEDLTEAWEYNDEQ